MNILVKQQIKKIGQLVLVATVGVTLLSGCITALVAGAVITTVDIIHDRRSAGEYVDDNTIELTAQNYLISTKALRAGVHIKQVSWNGIFLITGEIDQESTKQEVIAHLNAISGVRQLVDETTITGKTAMLARTNDSWITSKVKASLLVKTGLDANRVKVLTTDGSVYLMGIVTREEGQRATDLARKVKGVARVVKVFEYTKI